MQEDVNQLEEALQGEDDNIESPCCIVSCWQLRGRNQQQTILQRCTVLHINGVSKCVCILLQYVCACLFACTRAVCLQLGIMINHGKVKLQKLSDDYTAVCILHTM